MILKELLTALIFMSVISVYSAEKADSTDILDKNIVHQSLYSNFREKVFDNPASNFFRQRYSLTSISFDGVKNNSSDYKIGQTGKSTDFWELKATSHYIIDKSNIVWGRASFNKGTRNDVLWNETSDFNMLYPYVMADELGGNLKYEQYFFDGGYAGRYKKWVVGADLNYRAMNEFRTIDPRPNNVVADLNAKLGIGRIFGSYLVSTAFYAGKYKQTCDLKYFNEIGAKKEFHLTGLGNEFARFSGACNNVFYKGNNYGASIDLAPVNSKGLSFSVNYNRFSFDKILSDFNRLALNHMKRELITSEIAWNTNIRDIHLIGIKADACFSKRRGLDNLFGDATGNVFPKIGSALMYKSDNEYARLSGLYEYIINRHFPIGIQPYVTYYRIESSHVISGNEFKSENITAGTTVSGCYARDIHLLRLSFNCSYRINQKTSLKVDKDMVCHKDMNDNLEHTAHYFNNDELRTTLSLRYQLTLPSRNLCCFVEASWLHESYMESQKNDLVLLTTGITI